MPMMKRASWWRRFSWMRKEGLKEREKNIYKDGLRVEKQFYNNKDKLYKRKVYEYEYRK